MIFANKTKKKKGYERDGNVIYKIFTRTVSFPELNGDIPNMNNNNVIF